MVLSQLHRVAASPLSSCSLISPAADSAAPAAAVPPKKRLASRAAAAAPAPDPIRSAPDPRTKTRAATAASTAAAPAAAAPAAAASRRRGPTRELSSDDWEEVQAIDVEEGNMLKVKFVGGEFYIGEVLEVFIEDDEDGHVVQVSSQGASR